MLTYTIYHAPRLSKVGCTTNYPGRHRQQGLRDNEVTVLEQWNVRKRTATSDPRAGNKEWAWADSFGYRRGQHYATHWWSLLSKEKCSELMSAWANERVANGTNPLSGPEQNRKRVQAGTHNFLHIPAEVRRDRGRKGGNNPNNGFHSGAASRAANGAGGRKCVALEKSGMQQKTTCPNCGSSGKCELWVGGTLPTANRCEHNYPSLAI